MKTLSKILGKDFDFKAAHLGLFVNDDLWLNDKWSVVINGETFDYSTGIGHRVEAKNFHPKGFKSVMFKNPVKTKENLELYKSEVLQVSKVKPLELDDVLYSILTDAQCVNGVDFEDFCTEFGYNEDSVKANEIYKACQKNAKKTRKFIPNLEEAHELFQDY